LQLHADKQNLEHLVPGKLVDPTEEEGDTSLAELLLGFLKFYGMEFNYIINGISVRDGGRYFNKGERNWIDKTQPWLLAVEDPVAIENDMSRTSYAMAEIQQSFASAYYALIAEKNDNDNNNVKNCINMYK